MQNKFFDSKLNTVLLVILIVLIVVALLVMFQNSQNNKQIDSLVSVQNTENIENKDIDYSDVDPKLVADIADGYRLKAKNAEIHSVKVDENSNVSFSVAWVENNPKWTPGGDEEFWIHADKKLTTVSYQYSVEIFTCGNGYDGNPTTPDVPGDEVKFLSRVYEILIKDRSFLPVWSFVMDGSNITRIYEQCLP